VGPLSMQLHEFASSSDAQAHRAYLPGLWVFGLAGGPGIGVVGRDVPAVERLWGHGQHRDPAPQPQRAGPGPAPRLAPAGVLHPGRPDPALEPPLRGAGRGSSRAEGTSQGEAGYGQEGRGELLSHREALPEPELQCRWERAAGGGNSRYICLYDTTDRVLLRRFEISSNRSLDGVLDVLNSKRMTDAGPLDLLNAGESEGEEEEGVSRQRRGRKRALTSLGQCLTRGGPKCVPAASPSPPRARPGLLRPRRGWRCLDKTLGCSSTPQSSTSVSPPRWGAPVAHRCMASRAQAPCAAGQPPCLTKGSLRSKGPLPLTGAFVGRQANAHSC